MTWVERPVGLIKRGSGVQALKVSLKNKGRECFERGNICH